MHIIEESYLQTFLHSLCTAIEEFAYVQYNHVRPHSYNDYKTPYDARVVVLQKSLTSTLQPMVRSHLFDPLKYQSPYLRNWYVTVSRNVHSWNYRFLYSDNHT